MLTAIERSIAYESKLQSFLNWLFHKSQSIQGNFKPAAIRDFYYALERVRALGYDCTLDRDLTLQRDLNLDNNFTVFLNRILTLDISQALDSAPLGTEITLVLDFSLARTLDFAFAQNPDIVFRLNYLLARTLKLTNDENLVKKLQQLKEALPVSNSSNNFYHWWLADGSQWIEQLRQGTIEYRNIGYDWQFTHQQKQQIKSYYATNVFLVNLLHIEGAVTEETRAEIEESLLLPWEELQRRYPGLYCDENSD